MGRPADEQGSATWAAEKLHPSSPAHVQPSDVASRACVIELFHSQVRLFIQLIYVFYIAGEPLGKFAIVERPVGLTVGSDG